MRVLFDARPLLDAPRGGVGRVALAQAKNLLTQDQVEVIFFTTGSRPPSFPQELLSSRAIHRHINIPNKVWSTLCIFGFHPLSWFFTESPDLLVLPNIGFIGAPRSWKVQLTVHDLSFLIEPRWFRFKQRLWHRFVRPKKQFRQACDLLCVSGRTKQDLIQLVGIREERCRVTPVEIPLFSPLDPPTILPHLEKKRIILAFGADDPRKNFATAKFAVETLKQEPGFEDLELLAIGRDIQPTDQELALLYKQASALLYPSWYEGFGLPLHEASRHGCPAVSSPAGALSETAPKGTIFAHPAKPHHWVEALRLVLAST